MDKRYIAAKKVTLLGAAINALLGIIKLLFGIIGHSHALIADGIHSFSDLLTDAMVIVASKFGSQDADEDHPYGHQRIETAATMLLSLLLIVTGLGIAVDAMQQLWASHSETPEPIVAWIAGLSILANEALYHYTHYIGKKIDSELIVANAWHHRSDAASSVIVLIGVVGAMAGYLHFDSMAAMIVGLMIVKMGWQLGWSSVRELIDTGVEPETLLQIEQLIKQVPGVKEAHQLRTRSMGGTIFIDVHILVDPHLSVSEGHHIAHRVHHDLIAKMPIVGDVTVHIDPEDDEIAPLSNRLPAREVLLPQLLAAWHQKRLIDTPQRIVFHYIHGRIELEIITCEILDKGTDTRLLECSRQVCKDIEDIKLYQMLE